MDQTDKKAEHKANVAKQLAAATSPEARTRIVLTATIDAMEAKFKRMVQDFADEIAFARAHLDETVASITHGVKG